MQIIFLILSFLIYPFYSSAMILRDLIRERAKGIDFGAMQDSFYVMNFFMVFSKYIILFSSVLAALAAVYISKEFVNFPIINFIIGISSFVIVYWITSILVFFVQGMSWILTTIRKVSKDVEQISRKSEDEIKKLVH